MFSLQEEWEWEQEWVMDSQHLELDMELEDLVMQRQPQLTLWDMEDTMNMG